jgi:hypothetical protein
MKLKISLGKRMTRSLGERMKMSLKLREWRLREIVTLNTLKNWVLTLWLMQ